MTSFFAPVAQFGYVFNTKKSERLLTEEYFIFTGKKALGREFKSSQVRFFNF